MRQRWTVLAVGCGLVVALCGCTSTGARADDDIRLVVAAEVGTNADLVARAIAPCLSERLDTGVTVASRPGEKGMTGTREFLAADGPRLLIASMGPTVVAPTVVPDPGYRTDDFLFVGLVHSAPMVLFTAGNGPHDTAEALFAAARAGDGPVEVASTGSVMTEPFVVRELNVLRDTRLEHRLAGSDADVLREVTAGTSAAGLATLSADLVDRIEAGEITVLAVGGEDPPGYLPDAPPIHRVTEDVTLLEHPVDTALIAPDTVSDRLYLSLSAALDACLDTVRDAVGADFVPDDPIGHGNLRTRYVRLDSSVRYARDRDE
ncbi:tripartite tricarboxylate transporter substrate-binding protein [Actinophytocola sp. KF-1]